ncbi:MAG TPA: stage II sporulation protein M [Oscillatoriales cyanobacterium M59_W2019_021]|nr:MAG: stage II sporulation protein M [Cyanobacteria bacterium J055]HIK31361.1 stage II sporulation protein M [Oscillatoriales cyanobacterium M4454_W2019_049]HIK51084.1 stage II sporulation protein M [Oscillatoriales cyanobacterium M59_W2019_021]
MNVRRWIARREPNWKQLETLLRKVEKKGISKLTADEVRQMASLYRSVSADLARARTYDVGVAVIRDLQQLTSRGYNQIYQGSRQQEWRKVWEFCRWGFPQVVRQTLPYIATATAIFAVGVLVAWWYAWQDPVFLEAIVPEHLIEKVRDRGELWMGSIVGIEPLASSGIMQNNLKVAFTAVGGGITAGILTVYILAFNGLHIGAIATLVGQNNLTYPFWAFVLPHGSLELPAIFFAGGAGLLIARALLFPGKYGRSAALKFYGTQATQLIFGIVPMLIVAGVIEGFFSPNPAIPDAVKYVVGMGIFALFVGYCSRQRSVE